MHVIVIVIVVLHHLGHVDIRLDRFIDRDILRQLEAFALHQMLLPLLPRDGQLTRGLVELGREVLGPLRVPVIFGLRRRPRFGAENQHLAVLTRGLLLRLLGPVADLEVEG